MKALWLLIIGALAGTAGLVLLAPHGGPGGSVVGGTGISIVGVPAQVQIFGGPFDGKSPLKISMLGDSSAASLFGTFGSAALRSTTGGVLDFGQGFSLTMTGAKDSLIYRPYNNRISILEDQFISYFHDGCSNSAPAPAKDPSEGDWLMVGSTNFVTPSELSLVCTGLWEHVIGTQGFLQNPDVRFNASVVLTLDDGRQFAQTISSTQSNAAWLGPDNSTIMTCSWSGNIVTGDSPPDARAAVIAYSMKSKQWNLVTNADWFAYQQAAAVPVSATVPQQYIYSNPWSRSVQGRQLFSSPGSLPVAGAWLPDGSGYAISTAPQVQRIQIDCLIDGQLLGLSKPSGLPTLQFVGASPSPYYAGSPGTLTFQAGNMGNVSAGFDLAASCNGAAVATPQRITLDAKQTAQVQLPFFIASAGNYSCAGTLTDVTSQAAAGQAKAVFVLAPQVCQPGQAAPVGNDVGTRKIQVCKANGSGWEVKLDCSGSIKKTISGSFCASPSLQADAKSFVTGISSTGAATYGNATGAACNYGTNDPKTGIYSTVPGGATFTTAYQVTYQPGLSYDPLAGAWSCSLPGSAASQTLKIDFAAGAYNPDTVTPIPVPAAPPVSQTPQPAGGGAPAPSPGFEAVFAVAGLIAVAWLSNRRKL